MSQWNYLKLEIGIMDTLLRQWIGFEDFKILNSSNILKEICNFFPFPSLTIITGQRSFSSLSDWLRDITSETKKLFWTFLLQNPEAFKIIFQYFENF